MIPTSTGLDKPGPRPASTEIRSTDSPGGAGATGTRDFHTDGHQLPNPDIAQQTASPASRDRSEGGPLDRWEWVHDVAVHHRLGHREFRVLSYLSLKAGKNLHRPFCWSESEVSIGHQLGISESAVRRAVHQLVKLALVAIDRSGKGGHSKLASVYRVQGNRHFWRAEGTPTATSALFPTKQPPVLEHQPPLLP